VEDNFANQKLVLRVLDKFGYAAEVASNGLEAVEKIRGADFDVVLMDIQMPVMDGYQATTAIRALPDHEKSGIPIVALTAHARKGDEQHCLSAGMDAYLNKPIGARKLIAVLERFTKRMGEATLCGSESALLISEPSVLPSSSITNRVFDLQEALNRCFDREMFEQMREYFFTQSAEILKQIRDALARCAGEEIARAAHALKGTVVYLGSCSCLEAIENLEHVSRNGDLTSADKSIEYLAAQIELLKKELVLIADK
jgi:two-component system, sensor histidine kinase and response regulator